MIQTEDAALSRCTLRAIPPDPEHAYRWHMGYHVGLHIDVTVYPEPQLLNAVAFWIGRAHHHGPQSNAQSAEYLSGVLDALTDRIDPGDLLWWTP